MKTDIETTRALIEAQGFTGLDDATLEAIDYWLRFSPAVCMVWVAAGTLLESAALMLTLAPLAMFGALLPGHPFDIVYNLGVCRLTGGPPIPRYAGPRRFACIVAAAFLMCAAYGFESGLPVAGRLSGCGLAAAAAVNVTTGFCIPSFVWQRATRWLERRPEHAVC